jgi:hypothetical protein
MHHLACAQDKQQVQCNDMSTGGTVVLLPCGIPHHQYHYSKTVTVQDPVLWLLNVKNVISDINMFKLKSAEKGSNE